MFFITIKYRTYYIIIRIFLGGDLLSFSLVLLSILIVILMILARISVFNMKNYIIEFLYINTFLLLFLIVSFRVYNLFLYYLFFECRLIPTVFLIFGWGYQPERLISGYYLLFYTLFFSLPMLLGIFYIDSLCFSLFYGMININTNFYIYISMIMAFLVKIPIVFLHFWLPKAHVEAPISGSMILAGVLLKLGGYGIIRVFLFLKYSFYNYIFICLSLFGIIIIGFICLFQIDIKSLIAYSSVSHIGLVICGLIRLNYLGIIGSLVLIIAHGLCSSAIFCLANIVYERRGSRNLFVNKGILLYIPNISIFWFMIMVNNIARPPSMNLVGEIILINRLISWRNLSLLLLIFSSFVRCLYRIYLYRSINHGSIYGGVNSFFNGYVVEYILLFIHWIPLNVSFIKLDIFSLIFYLGSLI